MKKLLFFITVIGLSVTGCDPDDSGRYRVVTPPTQDDHTADGEWHLVQVTGSIAGINHVYEPGTITWTFNDNWTITVENNNTDETLTDFFDSGTYSYLFGPNEDAPEVCGEVLKVDTTEFGCREIDGDEMILTNTWADGYQVRFIRMQ